MARMIPAIIDPGTPSLGERDAFQRLEGDPMTRSWTVIHSLYLPNHVRQISGELDFVVLVPERGILCLEIKASARIARRDGMWFYGKESKGDPRGPFRQASEGMHSLRERLRKRYQPAARAVFWSAVVLPFTSLEFESEEWHQWQLIDSARYRSTSLAASCLDVLDQARAFLTEAGSARWFDPDSTIPTETHCDEIARTLRPDFEVFQSPRARRRQANAELKRYTEDQFAALDAMVLNTRVVFEGPAGTGKTLLAIEAAQRATSEGKRTLLVCFNRLLGGWLRDEAGNLGAHVWAGTLHSYMLGLAGVKDDLTSANRAFWQEELPLRALERLLDAEGQEPFDVLVVDEAQDLLHDAYLDVLDMSLAGGLSSGEWRFFGDFERQSIYRSGTSKLSDFLAHRVGATPVFRIRTNCRNRPRVAALVRVLGHLDPDYTRVLRPDDGVEPDLKFYSDDSVGPTSLVQVLAELCRDGYRGSDVVVLSPRASDSCAERVLELPWRDRLRPVSGPSDGHILYDTIHGFKGMEAAAVIVTDLDEVSGEAAEALFYVAVTRATELLVLLMPESARPSMVGLLSGMPTGEGTGV
jgi:ATP:corrinoid adenosyltransferase